MNHNVSFFPPHAFSLSLKISKKCTFFKDHNIIHLNYVVVFTIYYNVECGDIYYKPKLVQFYGFLMLKCDFMNK